MFDLLIRAGTIVDGSGSPAYHADVAVAGGRIVRIAASIESEARCSIEARGLCLTPGFIDPHTHSDLTLLADPRAESSIRQGVTTEVIGNCGFSAAPLFGAAIALAQDEADRFGVRIDWHDMAGYLERLRLGGTAVNVAPLAGHNMVRGGVLGHCATQPSSGQLAEMIRLAEAAGEQGARGLSSGLIYPPGCFSSRAEVAALARAAASRAGDRGLYASHIRDESSGVLDAVEEAIAIGEEAGVPVEVSHLKICGRVNWPLLEPLLAAVEAAGQRAVPVGFDQYPYTASSTLLTALLPTAYLQGEASTVARRLSVPAVRALLRADYQADRRGWDERGGVDRWEDIVIGSCPGDEEASARSVADLASERRREPLDIVFDLIAGSEGQVEARYHDQSEEAVRALMKHPSVAVGSDGWSVAPDGPLASIPVHPGNYGTFPRVLGRYVRELGLLTLEEAVRKMTGLTAGRLGLSGRGLVAEGAWADLVLFDPATVREADSSGRTHPFPEGIVAVIVNGELVLHEGERTAALPGMVLGD